MTDAIVSTNLLEHLIKMPLCGKFIAGLRSALAALAAAQGTADYIEITNAEMYALLGVSHNTHDRYMHELVDLGLVTRTPGQGKVRTTVVADAVAKWIKDAGAGPLSVDDALHAGRPELALSIQLSEYGLPDDEPQG